MQDLLVCPSFKKAPDPTKSPLDFDLGRVGYLRLNGESPKKTTHCKLVFLLDNFILFLTFTKSYFSDTFKTAGALPWPERGWIRPNIPVPLP
ncbi:MAG: hypothetical protein HW380_3069 [Magnetococcales bacterium]|nr:hypothetical protein [Magnetococcales bacterium]